MAPQRRNAAAFMQLAQDRYRIANHHAQGLTKGCKCLLEIAKTFCRECPLARRYVGLRPQIRLHNIQWQHRSGLCGHCQRAVILDPEIAFEPDNVEWPVHDKLAPCNTVGMWALKAK